MIIFIVAAIFSTQILLAETNVNISNNGGNSKTNVNVETNTGQNTICQNGKCTTAESNNGKSTVCVNGKCNSAEDGNLDIKSEDGNTSVIIKNKDTSTLSAETNTNLSDDNSSRGAQDKKNQIKREIVDKRNTIQKIFDNINNFFKTLRFF